MSKLVSQRLRLSAASRVPVRRLVLHVAASALLLVCPPLLVAGDDTQPFQFVSAVTSGGNLRGRPASRLLQDDEALHGAASLFRKEVIGIVAQGDDQGGDLHEDGKGGEPEEEIGHHHEDDMDEAEDRLDLHSAEEEDDHSDAHDHASHHAVELPDGHSEGDGHDHTFLLAQTQSSASGYDVDSGKSPICWISEGTTLSSRGLNDTDRYPYIWHTNFAQDFFAGPTNMLESCFEGFELEVEPPRPDEREEGDKLYTKKPYVFRIHGRLDLSGVRETMGQLTSIYGEASELGTGAMTLRPRVSVELVFCRIRTMGGGLCSPFIYQHDVHGDAHVQDNDGEAHGSHDDFAVGEEQGEHESHDSGGDSHHDHRRVQEGGHSDHAETVEVEEDHHGHESHDDDDHEFLTIEDHEHDNGHDSHDGEAGHDHAFLTSGALMIDVDPDSSVIDIDVHVPFVMTAPESVFAIAVVRTLLSNAAVTTNGELFDNANDAFTYKFDASNIISERVIVYEDAPRVNSVSRGMLIFSFLLIGIAGAIIAALLGLVVKHRKHKVFKLSQGSFLIAFLGSALVASASSFLFNPKNELYCNLYGPLIMIPLQFMVAVITGRLWRIHSLMQPLMGWANKTHKVLPKRDARKAAKRWLPKYRTSSGSQSQEEDPSPSSTATSPSASRSSSGRLLRKFLSGRTKQSSSSLRRKVSGKHMAFLIMLITLPQILMQAILLSVSPFHHVVDWNDEMTVGRYNCYNRVSAFNWLDYAIFLVAVVVLLAVAFRSRNLPSLFNEAGEMFSSVLASLAVAAIGVALIFATNTPTSNPDVGYLLSVVIVLCFTLQMSVRIILPKLKLVWSGEAIVVGKLFQEHASKGKRSWKDAPSLGGSMSRIIAPAALAGSLKGSQKNKEPDNRINHVGTSDKAENGSSSEQQHVHLPATSSITFQTEYSAGNNAQGGLPLEDQNDESNEAQTRSDMGESSQKHDVVLEVPSSKRVHFDSATSENTRDSAIEIHENEAPPQEMVMNLLGVSQLLTRSSQRMLSGLQVSREEWEELQDSFIKMGHTFEQNVTFDWQQENQNEQGIDLERAP